MAMSFIKTTCKTCRIYRLLLLAVVILAGLYYAARAEDAADHTLEIDGVMHDLKLGTPRKIKLPDGREVSLLLKRKQFSVFSANGTSFEHPAAMAVNSSPEDDGMFQHIAVSALGSLMLLQIHDSVDLRLLLNTVYDKMVEEPMAMNIRVEKTQITRTLKNGITLSGLRATYKSADDDVTIDMLTHKGAANSYLAMTLHDLNSAPAEKVYIDRFWSTLALE